MICVYPADCTDFSTNGNGTISPLTAEVTETLNGEYELTVVHPIDGEGKWQRLVEGCILRSGFHFIPYRNADQRVLRVDPGRHRF